MPETLDVIDSSQRTAAKVAAVAYLAGFALLVYTNFGLRAGVYVAGDFSGTIGRIAAAERLLRLSAALDVVYCIAVVVALSALYRVVGHIHRRLAMLAVLLKVMYAVTTMLMAMNVLSAVRMATDASYVRALGDKPVQALISMSWAATWDHYYIGLAFWSVSSTLMCWLWLKSRYIPAAMATIGIAASAWCAVCTFAYITSPGLSSVINLWLFDTPMVLIDIALSVWLLSKGLPGQVSRGVAI